MKVFLDKAHLRALQGGLGWFCGRSHKCQRFKSPKCEGGYKSYARGAYLQIMDSSFRCSQEVAQRSRFDAATTLDFFSRGLKQMNVFYVNMYV